MPLSSRIIKSMQTSAKESSDWVIDTTYDYEEEPEESYEETNQEAADELAQARKKSDQLIKTALTEKERLIEEAEAEISRIKEEAYAKAFEEGQQAGFSNGYAEGKEEGYQAGKIESQHLVEQARKALTDAQLDIEAYVEEKKDSLLSLSVHMAEKIVQDQLDLLPDGILELVNPILHQLDHKEDYVSLTVHTSKRLEIREKLPYLEKNYPGVRFVVFGDDNVDPLGCVVESAHKVVDLQVRNQLLAMVNEMKEREREM
ncbi:FliH/SctL family protein [Alkalibacterium olivapovliticus]|uniref:Flagellar assembly protein FliH n=1 Tax=Alkalibacterium olivapovliticus TaxID=99907 RepID=A0A2T0VYT6_9LACT|nr:FliH/SctL family protein [Alkalibacterium olivapovliticus]PRY77502.1 flagellar assembly protein FliH [Alkalibacterium olivapovliticus]